MDHGHLEVLRHCYVIRQGVQETHRRQELSDRNVVWLLGQELGNGDVILVQELRYGGVKEFCHSDVVGSLQELGHRDVVLKELGDCGVEKEAGGSGKVVG